MQIKKNKDSTYKGKWWVKKMQRKKWRRTGKVIRKPLPFIIVATSIFYFTPPPLFLWLPHHFLLSIAFPIIKSINCFFFLVWRKTKWFPITKKMVIVLSLINFAISAISVRPFYVLNKKNNMPLVAMCFKMSFFIILF